MSEVKVLEYIIDRINDEVNKLNTEYKSNYYDQVVANNMIMGLNKAESIILQELEVIKNG